MDAATKKPAGKGSLTVTIGALTVLAAIGGGLVGKLIVARFKVVPPAVVEPAKATTPVLESEVRELSPIVTNLASPAESRVRLQVAIIYDKKAVEQPNVLAAQITDDLMAFTKTLTLPQIQGASGLQNLREDLIERAVVRSQGKVKDLIIETLVVQ